MMKKEQSKHMANGTKVIYIGLFDQPLRNTTETSATFSLNVATGGNHWPADVVVTALLDDGEAQLQEPQGHDAAVFTYDGLAVGDHTWHASVVGTDVFEGDTDPGFSVTWTIVAP